MPDSVRHLQSMKDTMDRYHAEIKRLVDSSRIVCSENRESECHCPLGNRCPFKDWHSCGVDVIESVVEGVQ